MARPRIEIDYDEVIKLCHIQATAEEICYVLGISEDTLDRRLKEKYKVGYADFYKKHSSLGKISLRRNMFKMSETNATMAIWLSKQHLGMREPSIDLTIPEDEREEEMNEYEKWDSSKVY